MIKRSLTIVLTLVSMVVGSFFVNFPADSSHSISFLSMPSAIARRRSRRSSRSRRAIRSIKRIQSLIRTNNRTKYKRGTGQNLTCMRPDDIASDGTRCGDRAIER